GEAFGRAGVWRAFRGRLEHDVRLERHARNACQGLRARPGARHGRLALDVWSGHGAGKESLIMPKQVRKPVVPLTMMPQVGMKEVKAQDGSSYLLRNDLMFTAMQHAQGEFSDFFLALRDEGKIFGHRCPECRHLI